MQLSTHFTSEKVSPSRGKIRKHLYGNEKKLIKEFLDELSIDSSRRKAISENTKKWIHSIQRQKRPPFDIQSLLHAYPLSSEQGRALMCLAEALLRIPDSYTAKLLIQDKMSNADWSYLRESWANNNLVTVASKGLKLADTFLDEKSWTRFLKLASDPVLVRAFRIMMKLIGREFILGQDIGNAIERSKANKHDRFSYDMLGEAARTWSMAKHYKKSYQKAIHEISSRKNQSLLAMHERDSISVKLSALHPHYRFAKYDNVLETLGADLLDLCIQAKHAGIALTIDAEEVDRLELSLSLIEKTVSSPELKGWDGFGLAVQAYQKRTLPVIEWAEGLARKNKTTLMVRLVKGAYWDTEIKMAQTKGLPDYPVFTRKPATDISYLACAKRLLNAGKYLRPQFATHNVHTLAALRHLANGRNDIEFQRLQGMGEDIYKVVNKDHPLPVRVYAPVGTHKDLLAYLVRRLLENGANSSFIHKVYDKQYDISEVISDPFDFFDNNELGRHPEIPLPKNIYGEYRKNSEGFDLADPDALTKLQLEISTLNSTHNYSAGTGSETPSTNPAHVEETVGTVTESTLKDLDGMLDQAHKAQPLWDAVGAEHRASILENAADLLEKNRGDVLSLLITEAGKVLEDAQNEFREAIDFCRYYANEARRHYGKPTLLPGPTGEQNQLSLRGRGIFACISPWNFPLAIFTGQVTAALASGNTVIAKPASQTPLIAAKMVNLLHQAGVPNDVLHLLVGPGSTHGSALVEDLRVSGVVFTGSTATAQFMQKKLAERGGPIIPFIAETGGLNAMVVDASALMEQVVDDVITSAFQSAGQRCSALRVLYVQNEIYTPFLTMLEQATSELEVGDPQNLATDIGPVIDIKSRDEIQNYIRSMESHVKAQPSLPSECDPGAYIAPTLIEVKEISDVTKEVFGPVLHIIPFGAKEIERIMQDINNAGYGLTFGLQTRIGTTSKKIQRTMSVGNIYVNRNTIGAVVGVQPFGGEGLSGTGPKAGGPHYLPRFGVERTWTDNLTATGGNIELLNLKT